MTSDIPVEEGALNRAKLAIHNGLEYASMTLEEHDRAHGRTILKNKHWAEFIENDIAEMKAALEGLP